MAIAAPRGRADGDEHGLGPGDGGPQIGGEGEPPGLHILGHQRFKPRLVDRHLASLQPRDLGRVFVDADHVMAEIGKTDAGDQADIARSDHCDTHRVTAPMPFARILASAAQKARAQTP